MSEPQAHDYPPPSQITNTRITGAVRKLKEGFGFIAGDDGRDYFFHWTAMERTTRNFRELIIQDRVSFIVAESDRGPRAIQIRVISCA